MSNEELLKTRFKKIADYPNSTIENGDICTIVNEYGQFSFGSPIHQRMMESHPHLFQKLEWWEDRMTEDMPLYLKQTGMVDSFENPLPNVILKVRKHFSAGNGEWRDDSYRLFAADSYITSLKNCGYNYSDWEPATEEEYNSRFSPAQMSELKIE